MHKITASKLKSRLTYKTTRRIRPLIISLSFLLFCAFAGEDTQELTYSLVFKLYALASIHKNEPYIFKRHFA